DTDSLIVNEAGLCRLENQINSEFLGSLTVVNTETQILIRGLKDYSIATKDVVKGIRKNAVKIRDGVYEQEQWPSFKGLLRSGETDSYTVKRITKQLNREYTKGRVMDNGSILPFVLHEPAANFSQLL
ncbi:unnamed protein product, partial [marine sediment metagenome]